MTIALKRQVALGPHPSCTLTLLNIFSNAHIIYVMTVGATRWSPCPHNHKLLLYIGLGDQQVAPTTFQMVYWWAISSQARLQPDRF